MEGWQKVAKKVGRWMGGRLTVGKVEWVGCWVVGWVERVEGRGSSGYPLTFLGI